MSFYNKTSKMDFNETSGIYIDRYHYTTPLSSRYSSEEMSYNFSDMKRFQIFRWLWIYLAKSQKELGLEISNEQIEEMQSNVEEIDFDFIEEETCRHNHDIVAHLSEFSSRCPKAASIIHLGATSSYLGDNTDLILLRDGLDILLPKLANCMNKLSTFSLKYKDLPTIGYTHLNPAQLVTLGKRSCQWIADLLNDLNSLKAIRERLSNNFVGCKSSTGTSDTYLTLFNNDKEKVHKLEQLVAGFAGFKRCSTIPDRKIDIDTLAVLASLGGSVHKLCTDIRLLIGFKVLEEPLDSSSSHLAHKRNPLKSERCSALARNLFTIHLNALNTSSVQFLEKSSDDSIVKRCSVPEAYISADIILNTLQSLLSNLVVHTPIINKIVKQELPFLPTCTDRLVEALAKKGIKTEEASRKIASLQSKANYDFKERAIEYNLIEIISKEQFFAPIQDQLTNDIFNPLTYIGCSVELVESFIKNEVRPIISQHLKE